MEKEPKPKDIDDQEEDYDEEGLKHIIPTGNWKTVKKKVDNRNSKGNQRKGDYHKKGGQGGQRSPKKGIRKSKPNFFEARGRIDPILYKEWTG